MILDLPDLPKDWHLTHLIFLDPTWQANAKDDHHVCVATGDSPAEAAKALRTKILREDFCGQLWRPTKNLLERPIFDPRSLLQSLGLAKPLEIPRRMGL